MPGLFMQLILWLKQPVWGHEKTIQTVDQGAQGKQRTPSTVGRIYHLFPCFLAQGSHYIK